jgi:hypothetical protein
MKRYLVTFIYTYTVHGSHSEYIEAESEQEARCEAQINFCIEDAICDGKEKTDVYIDGVVEC